MAPTKVVSFGEMSHLSPISPTGRRDSSRSVPRKKILRPPEPPDPPDPPDLCESQPVQSLMVSVKRYGLCLNLYTDKYICLCYDTNIFQLNLSDITSALYLRGHFSVFIYPLRRGKFPYLLSRGFVDDLQVFDSIMNLCLSKLRIFSLLDLSILERFISMSFCLGQKRSLPPSSSFVKRDFPPTSLFESSQRGDTFPVSNPRKCSNTFIVLSSCVAVYTRPKEATEIVSTKPDDIGCLLKSQHMVTIFKQLGSTVDVIWTHPDFSSYTLCLIRGLLMDSLSSYLIYLYDFKFVMFKTYSILQGVERVFKLGFIVVKL
ncbi:unnamed protein product [Cochlearia groenlandica]